MATAEIKPYEARGRRRAASIATSLRVMFGHVRRICAKHQRSGKDYRKGRPQAIAPNRCKVRTVNVHTAEPVGVARAAINVRGEAEERVRDRAAIASVSASSKRRGKRSRGKRGAYSTTSTATTRLRPCHCATRNSRSSRPP